MKQIVLSKKFAIKNVINPLKKLGYNIELVGSLATIGKSNKDIDVLLRLPSYPKSENVYNKFNVALEKMGWKYQFSDENEEHIEWGVFKNYEKSFDNIIIGLDVFIEEYDVIKENILKKFINENLKYFLKFGEAIYFAQSPNTKKD